MIAKTMPGRQILTFLRCDGGAVTVDWTVLAAAVVGLGISSVAAVRTGVVSLGGDINLSLTNASVATNAAVEEQTRSYDPLRVDQDQIDDWITIFEAYSDEVLLNFYQNLEIWAAMYLDARDPGSAAIYIDLMNATNSVVQGRELALPDGVPSFDTTYNRYEDQVA